jgi:drug/metabolite transporter (DMT)-like permease
MKYQKNPGLFLAFGSAVAYTLGDTGVRLTVGELSVWGLVFIRGLLGMAGAATAALLLRKKLWGANFRLLSLIGLSGFLCTSLMFSTIVRIPLYQAFVILYMYPIFSLILAALINGEKISAGDSLRAFLALMGCLFLVWPDESAGLTLDIGHFLGLAASLCYSLSIVLTRRLGSDNSGLEPLFHYSLHCALGAIPLALLFGQGLGLNLNLNSVAGLLVATLSTMGQFLGYAALRWLPAHTVGTIGTMEVALGALLSWLFFHDPMTARAIFGGGLILGVALSVRPKP